LPLGGFTFSIFRKQLIGLAFGFEPKEVGFGLELVSAKKALAKIGLETPEREAVPVRPRKKEGLPMPEPLPTKRPKMAEEDEVVK